MSIEKSLYEHAHGRWDDKTQLTILTSYIADRCDATDFNQFLDLIVCEENRQTMAQPKPAEMQQMQAKFDADLMQGIATRLEAINTFTVEEQAGVVAIDAKVNPQSYTQVNEWLLLERPLEGFDVEGEVIFGYHLDFGEAEIIVALTNSPHGPWLDAWLQTPTAGMEPSPPPIGRLDMPITFERPSGIRVALKLSPAG